MLKICSTISSLELAFKRTCILSNIVLSKLSAILPYIRLSVVASKLTMVLFVKCALKLSAVYSNICFCILSSIYAYVCLCKVLIKGPLILLSVLAYPSVSVLTRISFIKRAFVGSSIYALLWMRAFILTNEVTGKQSTITLRIVCVKLSSIISCVVAFICS